MKQLQERRLKCVRLLSSSQNDCRKSSDILAGISSDILSDILSGIFSDSRSDSLFGTSSDILSGVGCLGNEF